MLEPGKEIAPDTPLNYRPERPRPETAERRLRVLHEDAEVLIVDKPAGVLTQPTEARERDTLLERASRYLKRTRRLDRPFVGIVHRIDRDTSGVVLMACAPKALKPFQELFRAHAIERAYVAIIEGSIEPSRGTIDLPLVADRGDGRRGVSRIEGRGVRAVTHYELVEDFGGTAASLVCRLETGKTHQIRIHLAETGHPVVGDAVYRSKTRPPFPIPFKRQALHAQSLGFVHPISGQKIDVESDLPTDLTELVGALKERYGAAPPLGG